MPNKIEKLRTLVIETEKILFTHEISIIKKKLELQGDSIIGHELYIGHQQRKRVSIIIDHFNLSNTIVIQLMSPEEIEENFGEFQEQLKKIKKSHARNCDLCFEIYLTIETWKMSNQLIDARHEIPYIGGHESEALVRHIDEHFKVFNREKVINVNSIYKNQAISS